MEEQKKQAPGKVEEARKEEARRKKKINKKIKNMPERAKQIYLKREETKRKKTQMKLNQLDAEKLGMAVIHNQRVAKCALDVEQLGDRLIAIKIKAYNNEVTIIGAHANHAGAGERKKEGFYNELEIRQAKLAKRTTV